MRKVTPAGVVTTLAGGVGVTGTNDGPGTEARFNYPEGVAVDGAGNVYVADTSNHTIRKVTPAGVVTTLAGTPGVSGTNNGTGTAAKFYYPFGLAVDTNGTVYVADTYNHVIRKITAAGAVTTFAGKMSTSGSANGTSTTARFYYPVGMAVGSGGTLYVADYGNNFIRKITSSGTVSTLAGTAGSSGSNNGTGSARALQSTVRRGGGPQERFGVCRRLRQPTHPQDHLRRRGDHPGRPDRRFRHQQWHRQCRALQLTQRRRGGQQRQCVYRRLTATKSCARLVLRAWSPIWRGWPGSPGPTTAPAPPPGSTVPAGVAVDGSGNVYVAEYQNHAIRKITPAGVVTTLAGRPGTSGTNNGTGTAARFTNPIGVAVDASGSVYVGDSGNHAIRKITSAGVVTTLAGLVGTSGTNDGVGAAARFYYPEDVAVDGSNYVYVADAGNHCIRKVAPDGTVTTLAGLCGNSGSDDGTNSTARFNNPLGIAVDSAGNLYVGDTGNQTHP